MLVVARISTCTMSKPLMIVGEVVSDLLAFQSPGPGSQASTCPRLDSSAREALAFNYSSGHILILASWTNGQASLIYMMGIYQLWC